MPLGKVPPNQGPHSIQSSECPNQKDQGTVNHSEPITRNTPSSWKDDVKKSVTNKARELIFFTGLFMIPGVISGLKSGFTIAAKNITSGTAKGVAAGIIRDLTVGLAYQVIVVGPSLSASFILGNSSWSEVKEEHQKEINARVFKKPPDQ